MPTSKRSTQPTPNKGHPVLGSGQSEGLRLAAPVESIHHMDRCANIPTDELRGFVAGDEQAPQGTALPAGPLAVGVAG